MSLMKMLNKKGPIMDPWGTHLIVHRESSTWGVSYVHTLLPVRKELPNNDTADSVRLHAAGFLAGIGNRKPSRDPSGWHQQNYHHRAITPSLRVVPEVLIDSCTLYGMPIEKDRKTLESSHPILVHQGSLKNL